MLPKEHILYGLIFSLVLAWTFPQVGIPGFIIIFISSFAIDIDHYIYYVYKSKNLSLKKAVSWYFINKDLFNKMSNKERGRVFTGLCFLHGLEAMIILVILAWIFPKFCNIFLFILLGFLFHQLLDAIHLYIINYKFEKVISFIYSARLNKDRKLLQELKNGRK